VPSEPTITGGGFAGAARRCDEVSARCHHVQRQHIVLHRAITNRIGAGGTRRRHTANGGIGPRIDREEQAHVAQVLVQLLAGHTRLKHHIQILCMHGDDALHHRGVDRHAAQRRVGMALERGASPERDDRQAMAGADPHRPHHIIRRQRVDHGIGRLVVDPGQRVGVLLPHGQARHQPIPKQGRQLMRGRRDRRIRCRGNDFWLKHGNYPEIQWRCVTG
jgi:hypothetical protein